MTIRRLVHWVIWAPILIVLIDFLLSNREPVEVGLFPTGMTTPVPLSFAILAAMGIGFLIGGVFAWLPALRHRRAAKNAMEALKALETKHQDLITRTSGPTLLSPR